MSAKKMDWTKKKIGFIGAGFMGASLARALFKSERFKEATRAQIFAYDPDTAIQGRLESEFGSTLVLARSNRELIERVDIAVLAVKPDIASGALSELVDFFNENRLSARFESDSTKKIIVSIVAGLSIGSIEKRLGSVAKIARAMPNMAASIGESATALAFAEGFSADEEALLKTLFDEVGDTRILPEKLFDAVTALSGSGPAYVYIFLEAMITAGAQMGLDRAVAVALAKQTLYGAARELIDSDEPICQMIDKISSPGGTTIAARVELEKRGFKFALISAIEKARSRSRRLGRKA